ncbi:uncharacterized protein MONBRDRAFT_34307 [Monosiga brevicollis MX1]|uniref:Uncharacterized protein n=1 Tax=Monosiga brevicollis TaxID=81824 RepID=A9VAU7_MONBE|nr:uncharacterized protein MONBRDRAFT_34307 [Monosiga brevicollis MX1]EDQ85382.1 predicted protein [Monosiga brevicollis MX1]|eukprot:XP_001749793.1 hypothetical protein [Monosiga brevicollis MX1]
MVAMVVVVAAGVGGAGAAGRRAVLAAAGGWSALGVRRGRHAFAWGANDGAAIGTGVSSAFTDRPQPMLQQGPTQQREGILLRPASLAAGVSHTLFVPKENPHEVWGLGLNTSGQLGTSLKKVLAAPTRLLTCDAPIKALAAGHEHSMVLTEDNEIWGAGLSSQQQLGVVQSEPYDWTTLSDVFAASLDTPIAHWSSLACGASHSVLLGQDQNQRAVVVTSGCNADGQAGPRPTLGDSDVLAPPGLLFGTAHASDTLSIAAGTDHTIIVERTLEGTRLWGTGNNEYGQLAQDPEAQDRLMELGLLMTLSPEETVQQVACSGSCTYVLIDGQVRRSGLDVQGPHVGFVPLQLPETDLRFRFIAANSMAFAAVDMQGQLWTMGAGHLAAHGHSTGPVDALTCLLNQEACQVFEGAKQVQDVVLGHDFGFAILDSQ